MRPAATLRVTAFATALTVLAAPAGAAKEPPAAQPGPVRDLHYGDVLFHFYQDDYFDAVVRLEASRDFGRLPHHAGEAELLAGGMYLSLGLHAEANRIFNRLLAGPVPQAARDRAHFYLARIGYQRGYYDEAAANLRRIEGSLPGDLESERRLLASNVLMSLGRFDQAGTALAGWDDGSAWSNYARFNLGVALIRSGAPASGKPLLEAVGAAPAFTEEERSLRDRANLALGFLLLQERAGEQAVAVLNRVRLDGPFTNRALLGLGWAESDAGRAERALVPWLELRGRPLLDSAVQESFLAVPYAYAQLASSGEAATRYRQAVQAFANEGRRIDDSIRAIRRGGFLDSILAAAPRDGDAGWFWQLSQVPDAPHTRYVYHLLASHEFQEGLKNYRDLRIMQVNLERWHQSLASFDDMITARERATAEREPRKQDMLASVDVEALAGQQGAAVARLDAIAAARDVAGLATETEGRQWQELEAIDRRLAALPPGPQQEAIAERVRILRGSLLWQMDAGYKQRLQQTRHSLDEVARLVAEARGRVGRAHEASDGARLDTAGFSARIGELRSRIADIAPRIEAATIRQETVLAELAVAELEAQKKRLASYATQAQFALASIYDSATARSKP